MYTPFVWMCRKRVTIYTLLVTMICRTAAMCILKDSVCIYENAPHSITDMNRPDMCLAVFLC